MISIVQVKVPLLNNILVTCSRTHNDRPGYWQVDPPIQHPNVFSCGSYLICNVNETPRMLLHQTHDFTNPCNINLAIAYHKKQQRLGSI